MYGNILSYCITLEIIEIECIVPEKTGKINLKILILKKTVKEKKSIGKVEKKEDLSKMA